MRKFVNALKEFQSIENRDFREELSNGKGKKNKKENNERIEDDEDDNNSNEEK